MPQGFPLTLSLSKGERKSLFNGLQDVGPWRETITGATARDAQATVAGCRPASHAGH